MVGEWSVNATEGVHLSLHVSPVQKAAPAPGTNGNPGIAQGLDHRLGLGVGPDQHGLVTPPTVRAASVADVAGDGRGLSALVDVTGNDRIRPAVLVGGHWFPSYQRPGRHPENLRCAPVVLAQLKHRGPRKVGVESI